MSKRATRPYADTPALKAGEALPITQVFGRLTEHVHGLMRKHEATGPFRLELLLEKTGRDSLDPESDPEVRIARVSLACVPHLAADYVKQE